MDDDMREATINRIDEAIALLRAACIRAEDDETRKDLNLAVENAKVAKERLMPF